jgi:hypothetical protein
MSLYQVATILGALTISLSAQAFQCKVISNGWRESKTIELVKTDSGGGSIFQNYRGQVSVNGHKVDLELRMGTVKTAIFGLYAKNSHTHQEIGSAEIQNLRQGVDVENTSLRTWVRAGEIDFSVVCAQNLSPSAD